MGILQTLKAGAKIFGLLTVALAGTAMGLVARSLRRSQQSTQSEPQSNTSPASSQTPALGGDTTTIALGECFRHTDGSTVDSSAYGWVTSPTIGWSKVSLGTIALLSHAEARLWTTLERRGSNLPN